MKPFTAGILLLLVINLSAQDKSEKIIKPRYGIHLTTMQGNVLKGLLLQVNDSSLILYPGKRKEWNNKVEYYPVSFGCSRIRELKLKKKNALVKGMLIGGGTGLAAILTTVLMKNMTAKGEAAKSAIIVVPAGMLGGAYLTAKSKKNYFINGSHLAFTEFEKQIQ